MVIKIKRLDWVIKLVKADKKRKVVSIEVFYGFGGWRDERELIRETEKE